MWLHENGAFQKRCRHDDALLSVIFSRQKTHTPLSKHELNKKNEL